MSSFWYGLMIGTVWGVTANRLLFLRFPQVIGRDRILTGLLVALSLDLLAVQIAWLAYGRAL